MKTFSGKILVNDVFCKIELQGLFLIFDLEDAFYLLCTFTDQFVKVKGTTRRSGTHLMRSLNLEHFVWALFLHHKIHDVCGSIYRANLVTLISPSRRAILVHKSVLGKEIKNFRQDHIWLDFTFWIQSLSLISFFLRAKHVLLYISAIYTISVV